VNVAAHVAARHAVSSIGLAALAVSAGIAMKPSASMQRAPIVVAQEIDLSEPPRPTLFGEIIVVGTAQHERVVDEIHAHEPAFSRCYLGARVVLFAHVVDGVVKTVDDNSSDSELSCEALVLSMIAFRVEGTFDVMVPLLQPVAPK
jgi:hypothetical protein